MREIRFIVIHCADTPLLKPTGDEYTAMDIDQWHKERGFRRQDGWKAKFNPSMQAIGYHYVIGVHGDIWTGRSEDEAGAHVKGWNSPSIGVCLIGGQGQGYTESQWASLEMLTHKLLEKHPKAAVMGHRDFPSVGKDCPKFDVKAWVANHMVARADQIVEAIA